MFRTVISRNWVNTVSKLTSNNAVLITKRNASYYPIDDDFYDLSEEQKQVR